MVVMCLLICSCSLLWCVQQIRKLEREVKDRPDAGFSDMMSLDGSLAASASGLSRRDILARKKMRRELQRLRQEQQALAKDKNAAVQLCMHPRSPPCV